MLPLSISTRLMALPACINTSFEDEVERDENGECRDSGEKQVCGHEPPLGIP